MAASEVATPRAQPCMRRRRPGGSMPVCKGKTRSRMRSHLGRPRWAALAHVRTCQRWNYKSPDEGRTLRGRHSPSSPSVLHGSLRAGGDAEREAGDPPLVTSGSRRSRAAGCAPGAGEREGAAVAAAAATGGRGASAKGVPSPAEGEAVVPGAAPSGGSGEGPRWSSCRWRRRVSPRHLSRTSWGVRRR